MGLKTADGNHLASGFQLLTKSHSYKLQCLSDGKCKFIENYSRLPLKDDIVDIFINVHFFLPSGKVRNRHCEIA